MDIADLNEVCFGLEVNNIEAEQITIKGKSTKTVSFTAPRTQYAEIGTMCEDRGWTFHTSQDEFIARHLDRYQIHIDGRTEL